MDVLNDQEKKTVEGKMTSEDRARCLIDTVMEKGERESRLMVDYLTERHPDLYWTLGLTPTSARIRFLRSQRSFGRKERPGLMSPSLPLVMHEGDSELGRVQLEGEGTYECSATGLVFEVSEQALVRYSVLSWFQFSEFLHDSWRPAGSIYDVDVVDKDPSVLKFIHFPHSLCIDEPEHDLSFSFLHVKERHANIETTVDFTASHVKWRVSSLSHVGPIIPSSLQVKHHALVLIYKELNKYHKNKFIFHLFLALNNDSEIKAIEEQVNESRKKCIKIYKPAACRLEEKFYHLTSEPEREIEPPKLEFVTEVLALKGFSEARFGECPPFRLFLKDSDCDEPLWSATINEEVPGGQQQTESRLNRDMEEKGIVAGQRLGTSASCSAEAVVPRQREAGLKR
ncbi:unnamed protein product [Boreogadus saida]